MLVRNWEKLFKKNDAYLQKGAWHNPKSGKKVVFVIYFKSPHVTWGEIMAADILKGAV
jgi:hypothetical protein